MKVDLKVPKKYQKYFDRLEAELGLVDDCPYILYFKEGYAWNGEYPSIAVKSKKEALQFISEAEIEHPYRLGDEIIISKECPICGKIYIEHSAISRKDNKTEICPNCGIYEALSDFAKTKS